MVAGTHPDDFELFDYVEGDLPVSRLAEVQSHVAECRHCAEQVHKVELGRDALRESQSMHLPERRGEAIFMNLPTRAREPGARRGLSPKQLLAVLTPLIALAAVVGVLANGRSSGNDQSAGATAASGGATAAAGGGAEAERAPVRTVVGPAADVSSELRRKGFSTQVLGDRVVVTGATPKAVRLALADRGPGDVVIVVSGR
jgi:anti-sigma factor RsiW